MKVHNSTYLTLMNENKKANKILSPEFDIQIFNSNQLLSLLLLLTITSTIAAAIMIAITSTITITIVSVTVPVYL